jgi:L-alanine-DL-glutamate epimerase-like enolase superfamily enzyme
MHYPPLELDPPLELEARVERWAINGAFAISRGAKREAVVVVAEVSDGKARGRGECVPYARYGETPDGVLAQTLVAGEALRKGISRAALMQLMPRGAARNAIDCALWDYEATARGVSAAAIAGLPPMRPALTCHTISLGDPLEMAARAAALHAYPLLKLKLGGKGDAERVAAVRAARPDARLVADANEGWRAGDAEALFAACAEAGVELVEQPFPVEADEILARIPRLTPVCADESVHATEDLEGLRDRYDAVNVKLDKAGGLTAALQQAGRAHELGFKIMAGCMVGTSLGMAPAMLLAQAAHWCDLDGPLLLAKDREPGLAFAGPLILPPPPELWG